MPTAPCPRCNGSVEMAPTCSECKGKGFTEVSTFCQECGKEHAELVRCPACGGCLYKHSSQRDENGKLISEEYPIVECTNLVNGQRCGRRVFWD